MYEAKREEIQRQISVAEALRQEQNQIVVTKLIITSLVLLLFPIVAFFGFMKLASSVIPDSNDRSFWAGFVSVSTVLVVMAAYVIMAFNEDLPDPKSASVKKAT